jgi:FkbM family methyltransferase
MSQLGFGAPFQFPEPSLRPPQSVAIIVRVMDRAAELRTSLPSLLNQDYPDYSVVIVDHSSQDDLAVVLETLKSPRLRVVRCPRPPYFNRSRAGNIGVRYSFSDLVFFLDTGVAFEDERHLSEIVAACERGLEIDHRHYGRWRQETGYPALEVTRGAGEGRARQVYCECECHGLHVLVSRSVFQRIGGLNEALHDWGYEDTDLTTRLELCGYGRIPIRALVESKHEDELRVRFHREKSKERSWTKNRLISDEFIRTFGPVLRTQRAPGLCDWIEIDGVLYPGADAPQQEWTMETAAEVPCGRGSVRNSPRNGPRAGVPVVSVVVPTKNAAEYLVGVLDSILSQDYPHIQCVVADGGSTDATLDILASYGDRIMWTSQPDRGAFDAINRGWQTSRGHILAWLNADDRWAPGAVSAAVECFQDDPEADVVYGDCLIIDAEGQLLERRQPPDWDLNYAVESCHHMIDQPAAFIRRAIVQRVGWLYPAWFHDWELWRRISLAGGKIKRVPRLLGCARVRVDDSQYRPEILIDGLVGLTKRFFSLPGVPADLQGVRRRALSNCYLKIVETLQFGRPERRGLQRLFQLKAVAADLTNLPNVLRMRPAARCPLPVTPWTEAQRATRPLRCRIARLFNEILELLSGPRRWVGQGVECVFARGNRELRLEIESLHRRVQAAEQADSAALQSVAAALESLRLEHEVLREELEAARERTTAKLADALREVYRTPPTLRPIPGWHYDWGVESRSDRLIQGRVDFWSSMKSPVVMRWLFDLLVMIWPGNELSRLLFLTGTFEPNELTWVSQTLTEGMTVIDVGAHMGVYSAIASKLVGESGLVIAMEPSTREFQRLAFHVTLNDLQNVRCVQAAASDFSGEAPLKIAWEWNSGHNTFGDFFIPTVELARKEVVRTRTIDALVAAEGLDRVDLIKIDVEGHELRALAGAVETLTRFRPRILIELFEQTLRRQSASEDEVLAFFRRYRYLLNEFSPVTGELVPLSRMASDQSRNIVALPA